jgi:hypothetical protein
MTHSAVVTLRLHSAQALLVSSAALQHCTHPQKAHFADRPISFLIVSSHLMLAPPFADGWSGYAFISCNSLLYSVALNLTAFSSQHIQPLKSSVLSLLQILLKRAEANKENGEHKKAIADTTQAIQLQPDNDKVSEKHQGSIGPAPAVGLH